MTECDWHRRPPGGGSPKRAFKSRGAAERSIQYIREIGERRAGGRKPKRAYVCDGCGRWFQTSDEDDREYE